jgi:hypothetical protein
MSVPQSLEEAILTAKSALKNALADGYQRVQVELVIPEIALQSQNLAFEFTTILSEYSSGLNVLFPDTGASALARRDWGETPFKINDLGTSRSPIERRIDDTDEIFLVVSPSAVEVGQVEKLCNLAGERPVILLIPQLEDVSIVGIGLAARQLRERFLSTLESCYYFRPLEGAAVVKIHPSPWQVWLETENNEYQLISELSTKPMGEALERILLQSTNNDDLNDTPNKTPISRKSGLLGSLQQFLKALNQ